jgi:NAD(P)-dependent dehydrogenase (short-subunit alcohol dehydrogenase family)
VTSGTDTVAVVTGAAGGMGSAMARAFAAEGRALVLTDLHPAPLEAVAAELRETVPVAVVPGDVTDPVLLERIWAALDGRRIGVLAHAAGVSPSMADGSRVFAINFTATRQLVEAALPRMAPGGTAILIASNSGQMVANPLIDRAVRKLLRGKGSLLARLMLRSPRGAYPLSKRAVQLYVPMMAPAFGKVGARIVSLSPGIIDTDMGRLENQAGPEMGRMIEVAALARMGRADEIASAAAFLASDAASYISGTDLLVDGGTVAGIAAAGGTMKLMR